MEKNNLPFELALLPIVESGYQPYAYSPSKAAGIWQFIPPTAKEYGLRRNWWYDGRRDIDKSTKAAAHFLKDMHRHFKRDWLLAIASYNTGAGKVGRSIKKANYTLGDKTFWDLDLPRETELYVPRLLALAKIIKNPSKYGFNLPKLNNKKQTSRVKFYDPIDFQTLAIITGLPQEKLMNLNPGYSTWIIDPAQQNTLLLPNKESKLFKSRYKKLSSIIYENKVYKVKKGDSLYKISRIYNVKIDSIKKVNSISGNTIYINQNIKIPSELNVSNKEIITINNQKYYINKKEITYNHIVKRYDNWFCDRTRSIN